MGPWQPVLIATRDPHAEQGEDHAGDEALDGLVGRYVRCQGTPPEHPARQIGGRIPQEHADEHVEHDGVSVGQPAQQHGVRQGEADPVDPQQRHSHAHHARLALHDRKPEQHRQGRYGNEQDLELVPVERREQQPGERDEAGEAHRVHAVVHPVELVHAHGAEHEQPEREHQAALDHEEQRDGERRNRGEHAAAQLRGRTTARPACPCSGRTARATASSSGGGPGGRTGSTGGPRAGGGVWAAGHQRSIIARRSDDGEPRTRPATARAPRV